MGIYNPAGARVTKAGFPATAAPNPLIRVTADVYTRHHDEGTRPSDTRDSVPEGSIRTVLWKAGTVVSQSQIDALFPPATIAAVTPATGPAAGGTVVTITGTNLDGVLVVGVCEDQNEYDDRDEEHTGPNEKVLAPQRRVDPAHEVVPQAGDGACGRAEEPVTHPMMAARPTPPIRPTAMMGRALLNMAPRPTSGPRRAGRTARRAG